MISRLPKSGSARLAHGSEVTRRDLDAYAGQRAALHQRLTEAESAIESARSQWQTQQSDVDAAQEEVTRRQQTRSRLHDKLAGARRRLSEIQAQHADFASRLQQMTERRATLDHDIAVQDKAQQAAAVESNELATKLASLTTVGADLDVEAATLTLQVETNETQIAGRRRSLEETQRRRQAAERELDRYRTRYDLLRRLQAEGAGYASGVRTVLQEGRAAPDSRTILHGILGTVASVVHVPAQLDKAIETALGGAFQNIITQSWGDAQAAIDFLKRTGNGRATFLPLDKLYVPPSITAPRRAGLLGNAAELVAYDAEVAPAILQLLNRVWVAENLSAARAALDGIHQGPRPTLVTLDGDIVRPGGAVTGGSDHSRRDESILGRERELRELPAQVRQASLAVEQHTSDVAGLSQTLESAQAELKALRGHATEIDGRRRQAQQEVENARRQLDRARQTASWHAERLAQLRNELAEIAHGTQDLQQKLAALSAEQRDAAASVDSTANAAEDAGADQLLQHLADLRAAAAAAQAALQNRQALHAGDERDLQTIEEQAAVKARQLYALERESEQLQAHIRELATQDEEMSRRIQTLHADIQPAERRLAELETQQAAAEATERTAQEQLRRDENASNAAQLHLERTQDALRRLRHDIEQDLGLVLLEAGADLAYQPPLPWDTIVEQLPVLNNLPDGLEEEVREQRARLSRIGNVNSEAPREYAEAAERHDYLSTQSHDLEAAIADLRKVIKELDEVMETELQQTFGAVAEHFVRFFQVLFNGGTAKLILSEPENITNSGIEIIARPPGKRPQSLALLSGGERTLTALALIFAILHVSPTPFCVLDEVDAALDEANVDRFRQTVEELSRLTQFIIITHNRRTLEGTNAIYGVTMHKDGTSRVISLRLDGDQIRRQDEQMVTTEPVPGDPPDEELREIEELVKM